jgi:segregation and condensation protein B
MTLKAKVEAVVYAAEEPVTLAQLAAVLANEVLEELAAEEEARASAEGDAAGQRPEAAEPDAEPDLWQEDAPPEPEPAAEEAESPAGTAAQIAGQKEGGLTASGESEIAGSHEAGDAAASTLTDEKKAARQRAARVRDRLQLILDELIAGYAEGDRGMEIREVAGGYRMTTKPEYHDAVRSFVKGLKPPMKLSLQALETLAVVAYKQPVTAPEVSEIRGVDSGGVLGNLIGRKLLTTAGRKHVIGRPILYKTTKEFLLRFGLKDLNELPSMEEFEKMAGEMAQAEAEAEDAAMRSSDMPQTGSDAVMPMAGSDLGEAQETGEPDEENVTSLDIAPSPLPMEHHAASEQPRAENEVKEEENSKGPSPPYDDLS